MDDKKKKIILGVTAGVGILVTGVGATVAIMSSNKESAGKPGFQNNTPTTEDVAAQPGEISIEPMPIALARTPDGQIQGIATVSALFKDFTVGSITINGDPQLSWKSECLAPGKVIKAGDRCNVTITYTPKSGALAAAAPTSGPFGSAAPAADGTTPSAAPVAQPEFVVMGNTQTPGGSVLPLERKVPIANADSNAPLAGAAGVPGGAGGVNAPMGATAIPTGAPAAGNLDPYGPTAPLPPTVGSTAATGLPAAPAVDNTTSAPARLTPREQFILARRQAAFTNVQARPQQSQQQKPQGTWADLNIPTATSSFPQDMSRVVTMDRIITAVLVRPYDSRASQQVIAQVDRNVYGAHGRNILIPRGSQIIGIATGGGERVAIQWKQIIRPDGARMVFEATAGDAMGQAGVPGRVNQRLLKRYGSILLGTVFKAGTAKVFGASESASDGYGSAPAKNNGAIIADLVRADVEKITSDIVQRNGAVQPIITVPAGTRITIVPTMDIQMRPMEAPIQEVRSYPRRQNGGAPSAPNNGNGNVDFDAPQATQRRQPEQPFPSAEVPETGNTPPWDSN